MWQYKSVRDDAKLRDRMKALAAERPRFGYRRIWAMLRREGVVVNRKRVYCLYRQDGLALRKRPRKQRSVAVRIPASCPLAPNQRWSMDFMSDQLEDGRRFRTFNVVDDRTRECLAIEVGPNMPAERVIAALEVIIAERGKPTTLVSDNGPEFTSLAMAGWAYRQGIGLQFIRPGKPVESAYIESFNGRVRDECLNQHVFSTFQEAEQTLRAWRHDYNHHRPHSSLNNASPAEVAARLKQAEPQMQSPSPIPVVL